MDKKQRESLAILLYVSYFILQLVAMFLYKGGYELFDEHVRANDLVYNLDKISWFCFALGALIDQGGKTKYVKRNIVVAVSFSMINELVGLNLYLHSLQYPVFWGLQVVTVFYSIWKYDPKRN